MRSRRRDQSSRGLLRRGITLPNALPIGPDPKSRPKPQQHADRRSIKPGPLRRSSSAHDVPPYPRRLKRESGPVEHGLLDWQQLLWVPNGTFAPRSAGHAASRRNPASCARRPASRDCGRAKTNVRTRMNCSPRSTVGSPKLRHQGFAGGEGLLAELEGSKHVVRLPEPFLVDVPLSAIMR